MGETLPRHYIIAIIVFTMVIMGGIGFISSFFADNMEKVDSDKFQSFNKTFNQYDALQQKVDSLEDATQSDPDPGLFGFLDSLVSAAWTSIKTVLTSFGFMATVFGGLTTIFGFPAWVGALIMSIITILVVFAIFSAIFQKEI